MKRFLKANMIAAAVVALVLTSCGNDDDDNRLISGSNYKTFNVESSSFEFDDDGVWTDADKPSSSDIVAVNGAEYSRYYNPARETMYGFQPSHVSNMTVTEAGVDGLLRGPMGYKPDARYNTYMVAHWNPTETTAGIPSAPSCCIRMANDKTFIPQTITLTNNAVTYYSMKNGLGQTAFDRNGRCDLKIYGVHSGVRSNPVVVTLGEGTSLGFDGIAKWQTINVEALGQCDYIYFQMESTAGDATPTYFCYLNMEAFN